MSEELVDEFDEDRTPVARMWDSYSSRIIVALIVAVLGFGPVAFRIL